VSVSLNKLGDFLAQRGLPGDAEAALKHYTSSLEMSEKLLAANPDSALAARDVSISLEKLGGFLTQRGQPGDAEAALKHYTRSLELREKLLAATPDSAQAARDVWVSCWKLAQHAESTGKGDAKAWWQRAHDILDGMVRRDMTVSPQDRRVLETLRAKVGAK
jgi:tetratricopeptide (TPR) repeat protein